MTGKLTIVYLEVSREDGETLQNGNKGDALIHTYIWSQFVDCLAVLLGYGADVWPCEVRGLLEHGCIDLDLATNFSSESTAMFQSYL